MKSLLILPLSLFSILHTSNAIPLPDRLRPDTLTLKHDQSHGKEEEGHHFMFLAKEEYTGKHQTTPPSTTTPTTTTTIISSWRDPDPANARLTDLEETETETKPQTSNSPESLNNHRRIENIISPSNEPKQSAQDNNNRSLKPSCPAHAGILRTVSRLLHGFSVPSFSSPSSSSKDNSEEKESNTTAPHNAASSAVPHHDSKAALEPWMIVLGMIWLVPITVVLVEMLEYAWMWYRGDANILDSIESSGRKSRLWMSADKMARGEKDMKIEGGYMIQPYYDDDDSSDDGFDDLVP
ncbi:hypothetical protein DTO195F2_896 [Paecilomyces variotii]|nr:hypothetical protein DTO195F2_896 [Paecilomyces variotii]